MSNGIELSEQQALVGTLKLVKAVDDLRLSLGFSRVSSLTPVVELKLRHGLLPARQLVLFCEPWEEKSCLKEEKRREEVIIQEEEEVPELIEDYDEVKEILASLWSLKVTFPLGFPHEKPCSFSVLTPYNASQEAKPQPLAVLEDDWMNLDEEDEEFEEENDEIDVETNIEFEAKLQLEASYIENILNRMSIIKDSSLNFPSPHQILDDFVSNLDFYDLNNEKIIKYDENIEEANEENLRSFRFSCRLCRSLLYTSSELSSHTKNFLLKQENEEGLQRKLKNKVCTSYFLEDSPSFLTSKELNSSEGGGRLLCPRCQARVGSWAWVGSACSCGEWIAPAFQFTMSKVDKI